MSGIVIAAKVTVVILALAYFGFALTTIFRLNSCLPADRKIRYRFAFSPPRTFAKNVAESYHQQFPQGRALTVTRRLLLLTVWALVAGIALDLLRLVITS